MCVFFLFPPTNDFFTRNLTPMFKCSTVFRNNFGSSRRTEVAIFFYFCCSFFNYWGGKNGETYGYNDNVPSVSYFINFTAYNSGVCRRREASPCLGIISFSFSIPSGAKETYTWINNLVGHLFFFCLSKCMRFAPVNLCTPPGNAEIIPKQN